MIIQQCDQITTVEQLSIGMMRDVCDLVDSEIVKGSMEGELKRLYDAIDELKNMEPSVPSERSSGKIFDFGSRQRFNSDGGAQINNFGGGHILLEGTFSGPVHF